MPKVPPNKKGHESNVSKQVSSSKVPKVVLDNIAEKKSEHSAIGNVQRDKLRKCKPKAEQANSADETSSPIKTRSAASAVEPAASGGCSRSKEKKSEVKSKPKEGKKLSGKGGIASTKKEPVKKSKETEGNNEDAAKNNPEKQEKSEATKVEKSVTKKKHREEGEKNDKSEKDVNKKRQNESRSNSDTDRDGEVIKMKLRDTTEKSEIELRSDKKAIPTHSAKSCDKPISASNKKDTKISSDGAKAERSKKEDKSLSDKDCKEPAKQEDGVSRKRIRSNSTSKYGKESAEKDGNTSDAFQKIESALKNNDQSKKIKFFMSKSKKSEKPKDLPPEKIDYSIYDNIDEDSEDLALKVSKNKKKKANLTAKKIGKETEIKMKQHLEQFKQSKLKRKTKVVDEKMTVSSDIEVDASNSKRFKISAENDKNESTKQENTSDDVGSGNNAPSTRSTKITKPSEEKGKVSGLKKTVTNKQSDDDSETDSNKKKVLAKNADKKPVAKQPKNDKFNKNTQRPKRLASLKMSRATSPQAKVYKRAPRMASLNAMAFVHCLYENDGVRSLSTSQDSSSCQEKRRTRRSKAPEIESAIEEPVVERKEPEEKKEKAPEVPPAKAPPNEPTESKKLDSDKEEPAEENFVMINRESLRTAPGLRSVGKHWDMNSSSITSSSTSDVEIETEKVKFVPKKRLVRADRGVEVDEESTEDEAKHRTLLLEQKNRTVRRRKRQRNEMTMDFKDMIVCKRMASLNAAAILAASYSNSTDKRTITIKSTEKLEEKRESVENIGKSDRLIKFRSRKRTYVKKTFCSSSDADIEDLDMDDDGRVREGSDLSGCEMVIGERIVKTSTSSERVLKTSAGERVIKKSTNNKQRLSVVVDEDTGVAIAGVMSSSKSSTKVSTTKVPHHQGYCTVSGVKYKMTTSSELQTESLSVTTEAMIKASPESVRSADSCLMSEKLSSPLQAIVHPPDHLTPSSYTPLGALSSMRPPSSPPHHHVHHISHPKTVAISATHEISSFERRGMPSAFTAPTVYGPPPPVPGRHAIVSKTPPEHGFVAGYYQPAGPLISHYHHHHHHHHHHDQANGNESAPASTSAGPVVPLEKQPLTPPSSTRAPAVVSDSSDGDVTPSSPPAVDDEPINYSPTGYRYGATNVTARSPPHSYQNFYPSPPSTASLHAQQQQTHYQEIVYSANAPPPYNLSYMQSKGVSSSRRFVPALAPPPTQQFFRAASPPTSSATVVAVQQQAHVVPVHPLATPAADYRAPDYPPLYYSGYGGTSPYYPYGASSRSLTFVETNCPCPVQGCQKNGHTGPLTGIISKGPVNQYEAPMSPVALSLPHEPHDFRGLPSPATGSTGCRPTPSPAVEPARDPMAGTADTPVSFQSARQSAKRDKLRRYRHRVAEKRCENVRSTICSGNAETISVVSTSVSNTLVFGEAKRRKLFDDDDMLRTYPIISKERLDKPGLVEEPAYKEKCDYLRALELRSVVEPVGLAGVVVRKSPHPEATASRDATSSSADTTQIETNDASGSSDVRRGRTQTANGDREQCGGASEASTSKGKRTARRKRRWTRKRRRVSTTAGFEEERRAKAELTALRLSRTSVPPKWSKGWSWCGEPFVGKVFLDMESPEVFRMCYPAMKHVTGDTIKSTECILLKSGSKKSDLPYVAKVAHLWENPEDGEMMVSLYWYYRPEHTEPKSTSTSESPYELYASKHKDFNSVACIEDKCYVLTFNEYCRYRKTVRMNAERVDPPVSLVPPLKGYPRQMYLPSEDTPLEMVFFCRKMYDFRQKRLLKNSDFI